MAITDYVEGVRRAADFIRSRGCSAACRKAVILGSGLAKAVPELEEARTIPYSEIPGFPRTTVAGHEGKLILGSLAGQGVAVMQGRFHFYEGHPMESIALPVRALRLLGLETLIVTAAVGSMREKIKPGHFTAITDHLNFMGRNPLRGFHEKECGEMFPDLSAAYDPGLRRQIIASCRKHRLPVHQGVYVAVSGPSYETPAEIRAFRALGADVVGMSVVPEVIVARQMGVRAAALTWTSNRAAGMKGAALDHQDVLALGEKVSRGLRLILQDLLLRI